MGARIVALCATVALCGAALAAPPVVGERFEVRVEDLPAPYASESANNPPRRVARPAGATLRVPPGFRATIFAAGLDHARWMTVAANGDVFLAQPNEGRITLLRDADGGGEAELIVTFARGLDRPHGLAIAGDYLYVADTRRVWRYRYTPGQTRALGGPLPVTRRGAFGPGGGSHWTRNLAFSRDESRFYVTIGSASNLRVEGEPRATVQVFDVDGSNQRTLAAGLRNPVGIALRPGTDEVYVVVNERDGMGDGLVPDYLTRVQDGAFYGWPYAYLGANPQPGLGSKRPDLVAATVVPDLLFEAHSAPLGLVFYDGAQFPDEYRGDAFVALHGSWNSAEPRGYMIARVRFENGRPAAHYEAFVTGFWFDGEDRARVFGRPAGLAVAADGSLLIADDVGQVIWRISYLP